jgi:hypothetical protein
MADEEKKEVVISENITPKTGKRLWKPGESGNPKGRPPGIENKLTQSVKAAFQAAFDNLGGADGLADWAQENKTDFYKLYARLIPVDVNAEVKHFVVKELTEISPQELLSAASAQLEGRQN